MICLSGTRPKSPHEIAARPWCEPPDMHHAKLNIDGALVKEDDMTEADMILRDHVGAVSLLQHK